jgi:murein DD-endopeptidase MepM/ murein hydrolase activator NlpD
MRRTILGVLAVVLGVAVAPPVAAAGTWLWPVTGPVLNAFDPPDSPYGSGHRGIDIAAPTETVAVAPSDGVVSFAGPIGGNLFLTLDHGGGLTSTFSWVSSLLVRRGDAVVAGQPVVLTGWAHPGSAVASLHFGVRLDGVYQDPLDYLDPIDVTSLIRLAPWDEQAA